MIKILSSQIPLFWEVIKFSSLSSDQVHESNYNNYCTNLLIDLLSGKKECYIVKEDNKIALVVIISFYFESYKKVSSLHIESLYGFAEESGKLIPKLMEDLINIAKNNNTEAIIGDVTNPKIHKIISDTLQSSKLRFIKSYTYSI